MGYNSLSKGRLHVSFSEKMCTCVCVCVCVSVCYSLKHFCIFVGSRLARTRATAYTSVCVSVRVSTHQNKTAAVSAAAAAVGLRRCEALCSLPSVFTFSFSLLTIHTWFLFDTQTILSSAREGVIHLVNSDAFNFFPFRCLLWLRYYYYYSKNIVVPAVTDRPLRNMRIWCVYINIIL